MKQFASGLVSEIGDPQNGIENKQFSLVRFATDSSIEANLGSSQNALTAINNLDYTGGITNHGDAIISCQSTLVGSLVPTFILMVTDGVATTQTGLYDPPAGVAHGIASAEEVKQGGTNIETVFINPDSASAGGS